jgi:hypothetical protein
MSEATRNCVIYNSKDGQVFYGQIGVERREVIKVIEHLGWIEQGLSGVDASAVLNEKIAQLGQAKFLAEAVCVPSPVR